MDASCPIDRLPDELLWSILTHHVGDRTLGACLLAWRRFHVLGVQDIERRKYRCATIQSICAAGDVDGLKFALDHSDIYMPLRSFHWGSCLFAAAVAGSVATLDAIRLAIGTHGPDGRWPAHPIMWWPLAFGAAQWGRGDALAWLCLPDNRTPSQPLLSAEEARDVGLLINIGSALTVGGTPLAVAPSFEDVEASLEALFTLFDPEVVARVRASLTGITPDAQEALCDRISLESGLDARAALRSPLFALPKVVARVSAPLTDDTPDDQADDVSDFDERLRREIEADDDRPGVMLCKAVKQGRLRDVEARFGKEAIVRRIATPAVCAVRIAIDSGHHDDAVWIYEAMRCSQERLATRPLSVVAPALARAGRVDLLDRIGCGPGGVPVDFEDAVDESTFWTKVVRNAAKGGHVCVLDTLCDRPIDKDSSGPLNAALENGHLDAAAWLCARGYNRTRIPHRPGHEATEDTRSFLYRALCERRFDVARVLLDPTLADADTPREKIDGRIGDAVAAAVRDALESGNPAVVTWLRERYESTVDKTATSLRADGWSVRGTAPEMSDLIVRLAAAQNS